MILYRVRIDSGIYVFFNITFKRDFRFHRPMSTFVKQNFTCQYRNYVWRTIKNIYSI